MRRTAAELARLDQCVQQIGSRYYVARRSRLTQRYIVPCRSACDGKWIRHLPELYTIPMMTAYSYTRREGARNRAARLLDKLNPWGES